MVVDVDAFTVQNMFEHVRGLPQSDHRVNDIGASIFFTEHRLERRDDFPRDIPSGGNTMEELQKQLGIPTEQAEAYKAAMDRDGLLSKSAI